MQFLFPVVTVLLFHLIPVSQSNYNVFIITVPKKTIDNLALGSGAENKRGFLDSITQSLRGYEKDEEYGNSAEKDYNSDDEARIVGGFEADISLYPYHAGYGSNCGGAIIDKKFVLTAAHCGKKPYVIVGSKQFGQGIQYTVKRTVIHPGWFARNKYHPFDFDFQIVELNEPLDFGFNIGKVKVAKESDMNVGDVLTVTGWGHVKEKGPYSELLRGVRVPIVSKAICQQVKFPYFQGTLTDRMFCAGFLEGKKDACQGDSGGPAVANGKLYGMVSFGYGCATPGSFGVYSKVALVRNWIESETGLNLD